MEDDPFVRRARELEDLGWRAVRVAAPVCLAAIVSRLIVSAWL